MEWAAAIGALLTLVLWIVKREAAKKADPLLQHEKRRNEINREITQGDERAANRSLDADLRRLQDLRGRQPGQGSAPDASQ